MGTDWFCNTTWNPAIEQAFDEKLRRARRKGQYLRIQASTLARSEPVVALRLLDRYFALPDDFDHAQAHVDRASAYLALDQAEDAITAYEDALARESVFPSLKTDAYIALPYLVATRRLRPWYSRAIEILAAHRSRLLFPVDHFRWHAARSLIAADTGDVTTASTHAVEALAAATVEHSGFRHHPSVGLVKGQFEGVVESLERYVSPNNSLERSRER